MFGSLKAGRKLTGIVILAACLVSLGTADALARGGGGGRGGGGFGGGFGGGHFGGGGMGGGFRGGDFGGGFGDRGSVGGAWHSDGYHPARDDPAGYDHARVVNHYYHNGCRNCRAAWNDDNDDDDFNYDYEDGSPFWGLPPNCTYVSGTEDQNCGTYGYRAAYGNNGMYYTRN